MIWINSQHRNTKTTSPDTEHYEGYARTALACLLSPPLACMQVGNPGLDAAAGAVESPYLVDG